MSSAASSLSGDSVVNLTTPSFRHPGCFRTDCRARRRGPFPPTRRYRLSRERKCLVDLLVHVADQIAQRIRSEEHTSELQSLMRISYAVLCLKTKKYSTQNRQLIFKSQNPI